MSNLEMAQQANCDVWVIPYLKLDHPLPFPSVLFVHDLVTSHFPDMFEREFVNSINRLAPARAAEAVLCACMSAFIRDTDLFGILGLPPSKVRMVPFAAPRDFSEVTAERSQLMKFRELIRPYVFLPAGIRGYKNQRNLILALRALRDDYGQQGIDLVLTGEIRGRLPKNLDELVRDGDLKDRVHVLGPVDRETLAALYQCALATIVPSLYEECSFPVSEALYWRCPLACSRIPAHVEQCAPMGDSMLYFDPHDPGEIARTILYIRDNWQDVRDRQRAASPAVFRWTWKDAAREWLLIFKEAAAMGRLISNETRPGAGLSEQTKAA
jgi:glycosyltransferase involved in cell wall biosynthesis